MRILVTRPREDGAALAERLVRAGHEVIHAPVMDILYADGPILDLHTYDAVLVTSANGARALARRTLRRDVPVLAVGAATAAVATELGFTHVTASGGDVTALVNTVCQHLPAGTALLHVAGSVTAGDLQGDLAARGYKVDRVVVYEARAVQALDAVAQSALRQGVDVALFYSPRTARLFVALVCDAHLQDTTRAVTAAGLSRAVTDALQSLPWRRIVTATEPAEAALLRAAGIAT
jgi:uroporphyrinogen-III synthase